MKFKIKKIVFVSVLICIILLSICPKAFATNGNEMSISSKEGIGNTIEIVSGNTTQIKSESVVDVVSFLTAQGVIVNSITNHKGVAVELTSTSLIGTGYVLNTINGDYSVIVYGDANGDGEVDAGDMKVIIDDFLGTKKASAISKIAVDVYKDGSLDAADLKLTLDSFLGNLKGSILNQTNAPTPTPDNNVTPTPDVSVTPTPVPTSTGSGPQIIVNGQAVTLTKENVAEYYGKKVTNYESSASVVWRLFYIDFDGKYGDAGKIYLKADLDYSSKSIILDHSTSIDSANALDVMKKMNPDWAENDGVVDENNEKTVLCLCDETKLSDYKNSDYADYVIAVPSIEMFFDSYNEYHTKKGTSGYKLAKCKWFDKTSENMSKGYMWTLNGDDNYVYTGSSRYPHIELDPYNIYKGTYWIASPSAMR